MASLQRESCRERKVKLSSYCSGEKMPSLQFLIKKQSIMPCLIVSVLLKFGLIVTSWVSSLMLQYLPSQSGLSGLWVKLRRNWVSLLRSPGLRGCAATWYIRGWHPGSCPHCYWFLLPCISDYHQYASCVYVHKVPDAVLPTAAWSPPLNHLVKVNFDAHLYTDGGIGCGMVVGDHMGVILAAGVQRWAGKWS